MRSIARLLPALVGLALLAGQAPAGAHLQGQAPHTHCEDAPARCVDVAVDATGMGLLNGTVRVLLPPGYSDPANASTTYPVLLLLHGAGDTYATWTENTDVIDFTAQMATEGKPLIVVMPDGGCQTSPSKPWCAGAGWYSDWVDGSRAYETFHITRVIPHIDASYRTNGKWAVAGLSMGGFGAMKYAAKYSGSTLLAPGTSPLFKAVGSFSGLLDPWYGAPVTGLLYDEFSGTITDGVWGDQTTSAPTWWANDPAFMPERLAGVQLWLSTGTGTPAADNGNMLDIGEALIFQTNVSFMRALATAGRVPEVGYETNLTIGGRHSWPFWETALHWALPEMHAVIA